MLSDVTGPLRVLYLVHALPPCEFTGTPLIAHAYAKRTADRGWKTTVVSADPSVARWGDVVDIREPGEWFHRLAVPPTRFGTWGLLAASDKRDPKSEATRFFVQTLRRTRPDLVHVVDNMHLPLGWPHLASQAGIPVVRSVISADDLCALGRPVSPASGPAGYCAAPLTPEKCLSCLTAKYGDDFEWPVQAGTGGSNPKTEDRPLERLKVKRAEAERQFGSVFERLIFSNAAWRHYFEEALPLDPDRVRMIETGIDLTVWRHPAARIAKGPGEPVVFALAGSPDPAGGHLDAVRAFTGPELVDRDDWRLRFLGAVDPAMLAPLLAPNPRVEIVGPYEPQDLPNHLATADVGLSTSLFATSDRVTREYLLAGLPVVANPTFGNRDLIVEGRNGIMYDRGQPDGLARAVCGVLNDRALLERLTAGAEAARPMVLSVDDEMAEIVSLYGEVVKARRGSR